MTVDDVRRVGFVGNHSPRLCGIATFTADLNRAVREAGVSTQVIAVKDGTDHHSYPPEVTFQIEQDEPKSYLEAAKFLNAQQLDVVCVQHEYGIYGGTAGAHILDLLSNLNAPIVTTLHTILQQPNQDQRSVLQELAKLSERLVVMSHKGKQLLNEVNNIDPDRVSVIPHGIPAIERRDPAPYLRQLGFFGKRLILTFGLISPSKGIETMIEAMPSIVARHPDALYLVVGATHPVVRRQTGERYRESLIQLAQSLGVSHAVAFVDRYVSMDELTDFLHAASIYVTPYLSKEQITSGTLARAYGMGKAVVSTPYWHAEELLADGSGVLVRFRDPSSLADGIISLFSDPGRLLRIQNRAYEQGKKMAWPVVGKEFVSAFREAVHSSRSLLKPSSPQSAGPKSRSVNDRLELKHLLTLTDTTGIIQHATHCVPKRAEGYCTDDNARLAILGVRLEQDPRYKELGIRLQNTALSFLLHAYNPHQGRMRNFMRYDRTWIEEIGSEDSHGRAMWALGVLSNSSSVPGIRSVARELFFNSIASVSVFTSLRGRAFTILGLVEMLASEYSKVCLKLLDGLAGSLNSRYVEVAEPDWKWFEQSLTYDNARLPQALLSAGHLLQNDAMMAHAKEGLSWLVTIQTDRKGCFLPIGSNGFYPRSRPRAIYDQQPIEALATIDACREALNVFGEPAWQLEIHRAFNWFHGANTELKSLIDDSTGGCRDGLMLRSVNLNQGAESTLAYITATLALIEAETESAHVRQNGFMA